MRSGVLLIASGGIGDNILLSQVLPRFLELAGPGEEIVLLIRADAAGAAFLFPPGITIETYDWRRFRRSFLYRWQLSRALHGRGFRLAMSTDYDRHPFVDDMLVAAADAPESLAETARPSAKFGRDLTKHEQLYTRLFEPRPTPTHRFVRLIRLANWATGQHRPVPRLNTMRPDSLPSSGLIVLHPFAGDPRKNVKPEIFRAVLGELPHASRIVLSAAPGDLSRSPEYEPLLADPRVYLDESPLEQKFAALQEADLAICGDTAMAHLAVIAGTPTLCIASAAYVSWAAPYDGRMMPHNVRFSVRHVSCAGCLGSCHLPLVEGRFPCVSDIAEDHIIAELRRLWAGLRPDSTAA